jgi:hypothetical protein
MKYVFFFILLLTMFGIDDRLRHLEHLAEAAQSRSPGYVQP